MCPRRKDKSSVFWLLLLHDYCCVEIARFFFAMCISSENPKIVKENLSVILSFNNPLIPLSYSNEQNLHIFCMNFILLTAQKK